jgi:uncharacterized protein YjiK
MGLAGAGNLTSGKKKTGACENRHMLCVYATACAVFFVSARPAFGASVSVSLGEYEKVAGTDISGIDATSISGATYYYPSNTLYVVDDTKVTVYEISTEGALIGSILLSGFEDTEGIAYQYDNFFLLVEERRGNVVRAELPSSGEVSWSDCTVINIGTGWGNSGLEGVAYSEALHAAYAVKELGPPRLYRVTFDETGSALGVFENDPFNIENISGDAADIVALADGSFLILNQEENTLFGYSASGEILSELALDMTKPEGVAVDTNSQKIFVVGEPRQLCIFEKPQTGIRQSSRISIESNSPLLFADRAHIAHPLFVSKKSLVFSALGRRPAPCARLTHARQQMRTPGRK